jgi:DNA-binding transcriptional MerR regulator
VIGETARTRYRSGLLAKLCGVSTDTLRHYERAGVLPAPRRRENGYREYPPEALARVRLIRNALAIGFTLAELAPLLRSRAAGRPPCREVRALAAEKLASVEARLADLTAFRDALAATLREWDRRLSRTGSGREARLLERLPAGESRHFEPFERRKNGGIR